MDEAIDVKALRDRLGWNQDQMADYLGVDRSTVSRMESGQAPSGPTKKLLRQLAENPPAPSGAGERAAVE